MTFDLLTQARQNTLRVLESCTPAQLNAIPTGLNNNLIWNAGHVVATCELLTYGLGGHPLLSDSDFINRYRKGSTPTGDVGEAEIAEIRERLLSRIDRLRSDVERLDWSNYRSYTTSFGTTVSSLEEALAFNNMHETLHLGTMLAQRRLV